MTTETKNPVPAVAEPAVGPVCATCAHWRCAEHDRAGSVYHPDPDKATEMEETDGRLRTDGVIRDDDGRGGGSVIGMCHLNQTTLRVTSDHYCSRHSDKTDFEAYWLREIHNMLFSKL